MAVFVESLPTEPVTFILFSPFVVIEPSIFIPIPFGDLLVISPVTFIQSAFDYILLT